MNKIVLVLGCFSILLFSCGGEEKQTLATEEQENTTQERVINYNIPSPSEQFALIAKMDGAKNIAAVNDPAAADAYSTSTQKALNFGVYTADVAYLTSFNETNKYLTYFGKLEKLGKDIGVAQVFGAELNNLAKKWDGNADSLFRLSDETYNKTFQKLIEIDKGEELSLMLIGGWFESMHLMLATSKGLDKSPKLSQQLADQKLVAENLLEFITSYQDNADIKKYASEVESVLKIYENMNCSSSETEVGNSNGKLTFSGGESCKLTEKSYNDLKAKIAGVRTAIVTSK